MSFTRRPLVAAVAMMLGSGLALSNVHADYRYGGGSNSDTKKVTLIHIGDIHGHTTPRPNLRSDGDGRMEGGLARMYTKIKQIRDDANNTLLINTGDTTQGSGEALYSRGQAMLDVLDYFNIDAFAPGNWEYVYGPARFEEEFGNGTGKYGKGNRWGALASNLYRTAPKDENGNIVGATSTVFASGKIPATLARVHTKAEYDEWHSWYLNNGERILPPYAIKTVGNMKVGIVGCTTRRGPQVVGKWVVEGIEFTDCAQEMPKFVAEVRSKGAELVVLITEIEVGANIELVSTSDALDGANHIDVILNSDMHEETVKPIEIPNKSRTATTLLIEEGQDGTMLGELEMKVRNKQVVSWEFAAHRISDRIPDDYTVAKKVRDARAPYTTKFAEYAADPVKREKYHKNPFNGTYLVGSLDESVGYAKKGLHRSGYTDEAAVSSDPDAMPAAIEGTSHDWIADAIRWWAGSDLATVRGFRYGTHVRPNGPIMRNDLYHYVPIGARVGKGGKIHANQLRNQVDNSSLSVFSTSPTDTNVYASPYNNEGWAGGWMFAYSGPTLSFDPYWVRRGATPGVYPGDSRSRGIKVTMACDQLPSVALTEDGNTKTQKQKCEELGQGVMETMINDDKTSEAAVAAGKRPGDWTTAWAANAPAGVPATFRDLVVSDVDGSWSTTTAPASHNKQNHMPVMSVAGYYYTQSPYTLNNCPNCNPRGTAPVVVGEDLPANAPFLLPVNMDPATGRAMLDENGRPVLETENGKTKWVNGAPVVAGEAIDLTVVLEKYLQNAGAEGDQYAAYDEARGRGPANPKSHRITLLKDLPGREYFGGTPVMQPLCGVVASYYSVADQSLKQSDRETAAVTYWGSPTDLRIMPSPADAGKPFPPACPQ